VKGSVLLPFQKILLEEAVMPNMIREITLGGKLNFSRVSFRKDQLTLSYAFSVYK
jgi:hypothetical protein